MAGTFAIFASVYYLYPKMTGKMYNETVGKWGFWLTFIGINLVFMLMIIVGVQGMPRRYYDYSQFPQLEPLQQLITVGAFIILASALVTLYNWIQGLVVGESVSARSAFRTDVFISLHAVFRGYVSACCENIAGAVKRFLRPVNLINLHKIVLASAGHHQTPPVRCRTANVCMRYV